MGFLGLFVFLRFFVHSSVQFLPILTWSPKLTLEAVSDAFPRPPFEFRRIFPPLFCGLLDGKSQFNASLERESVGGFFFCYGYFLVFPKTHQVSRTLIIGRAQHRDHRYKDRFWGANGEPTFASRLIAVPVG